MCTVYFKNGNMLPIKVHDDLTLTVILKTGGVNYVVVKGNGKTRRISEERLFELLVSQ